MSASTSWPTCKGANAVPGTAETLAQWLRYITCDGQIHMAQIGCAALPPNLAQGVADAIGRLQGVASEHLTAATCANPAFQSGP
jgi:hypothetical protein